VNALPLSPFTTKRVSFRSRTATLIFMPLEYPPSTSSTISPQLAHRFQALIWQCLDNDLLKSAVFHAERYYSLDSRNHDARHLYATALLTAKQTYSALHLVNVPLDEQCTGCLEIKAKCCTVLRRYRQATEALDATLSDTNYVSTGVWWHLCKCTDRG
jgi:anaphase-promoting complex subunit 3